MKSTRRSLPMPLPTQQRISLKGHVGHVQVVRFNKSGQYCMSGGQDKTIRLWNPHKGTLVKTYSGHGQSVHDIAATADNSRLASVGGDKLVFYWDVATGRVIRKFRGHDLAVNCIRFNADCSVAVTGSYDATVKAWDCRSNSISPIQEMRQATDSITALVVTGHEIIASSVDGSVRTYDVRTGRCLTDLFGLPLTSLRLSNDGNCMLVSCMNGGATLTDRHSGDVLNNYSGHVHGSYKVESTLSNDDAVALSGSEDGKVYFWDLVEANVVASMQAHAKGSCVTSLDYHPSDPCLLTASTDGLVNVWQTVQ